MTIKSVPYWWENFPRPDNLPVANELPEQVDVVIIGAGYTGLNAARILAKSGAVVAVLEGETIGWGASSRNGGMGTPGLKQKAKTIVKWFGIDRGREFWQTSLDAISLVDEIVKDEGLECDWAINGYVALAYKASHFEDMKQAAAWYAQELDYHLDVVEREDLLAEIGTKAYFGGLVGDFAGQLHPAKYVFGLAKAAAGYGACLLENARVRQIVKSPDNGFRVQTEQGNLRAKEVIVATNGYTDGLVPGLQPKIFPVGSYIIITEPLTEELQNYLNPKRRVFYDSKNFLHYFRMTQDGRFLWGGRNNLSTNLDLQTSANVLRKQMVATFPELEKIPITHTWTGKLGLTFDLMPHIGRMNGIHYAFGYGGHGVTIATYIGSEIGMLLAGMKSRTPFAEIPHNNKWFYRGRPWFIPFAAQYYRFLDWIS